MSYYDYSYYGDIPAEELELLIGTAVAVWLVIMVIGLLFGIVFHVFRSLSLQTIAKRRGLNNSWLSWVPVGQEWIIGSLSDQYKYVTQGKQQNRRKILLGLYLASTLISLVSSGISLARLFQSMEILFQSHSYSNSELVTALLPALLSLGATGISGIVGLVGYVFRQMAMYDVYKSCEPKNAVIFEVIGILFSFTEPFFLLSCRRRDNGMPPRRQNTQPIVEEPVGPEL